MHFLPLGLGAVCPTERVSFLCINHGRKVRDISILFHVGINYNCRIAVAQMQWRGWSTYSDIVAVWSWLDTEQSMINFTTEYVKVCVCVCACLCACACLCVLACLCVCAHACVGVRMCVFLFKCACMWVHLHAHAHRKILDRQSIDE